MNRIWNRSTIFLLSVFSGLFLSACSAIDSVKDMKKTTSSMADTTDRMNQTTDRMASDVNHTSETTDQVNGKTQSVLDATLDMYVDLRQGNSWELREHAWGNMTQAKEIPRKIAEAGAFFQAMEVQLYKANFRDDIKNLQGLQMAAVDQFLRNIQELIFGLHKEAFSKHWDTSPFSQDNRMKSLYALAVTLHLVNPNEERLFADRGLQKLSMLSMLEDALALRHQVNDQGRDSVADWVNEVLLYEDSARYMLRLRANFLPAMALGRLTGLEDENGFTQSLEGLGKSWFDWDVKLKYHNVTEIQTYTKWINQGVKTCDWLINQYGACKLSGNMMDIFEKMNVLDKDSAESHQSEARKAAVKDLKTAVKDLIARSKIHS